MKRPSFQFYPSDWRSNAKLRAASLIDRGVWIEVLCILHDSKEYGISRWPLVKLAASVPCHLNQLQSLVDQGILIGAPAGEMTPKHEYEDSNGVIHLILDTQPGPCWFSTRLLTDEFKRTSRVENGRKGGNPMITPAMKKRQDFMEKAAKRLGVNQMVNS